jgi:hypothetical protein
VCKDTIDQWHRSAERASLIADFQRKIEEVRPHAEAAYSVWDRWCTELLRLERALEELEALDDSLRSCTGHPGYGRRP